MLSITYPSAHSLNSRNVYIYSYHKQSNKHNEIAIIAIKSIHSWIIAFCDWFKIKIDCGMLNSSAIAIQTKHESQRQFWWKRKANWNECSEIRRNATFFQYNIESKLQSIQRHVLNNFLHIQCTKICKRIAFIFHLANRFAVHIHYIYLIYLWKWNYHLYMQISDNTF